MTLYACWHGMAERPEHPDRVRVNEAGIVIAYIRAEGGVPRWTSGPFYEAVLFQQPFGALRARTSSHAYVEVEDDGAVGFIQPRPALVLGGRTILPRPWQGADVDGPVTMYEIWEEAADVDRRSNDRIRVNTGGYVVDYLRRANDGMPFATVYTAAAMFQWTLDALAETTPNTFYAEVEDDGTDGAAAAWVAARERRRRRPV